MMNNVDGWMNGWMGGGMWLWTMIGVLVVVLLVVAITKLSNMLVYDCNKCGCRFEVGGNE